MKENLFREGEYIVLIGCPVGCPVGSDGKILTPDTRSFLINDVYKQRKNYPALSPELDSKGSQHNGWSCYSYEYSNWRYATDIEKDAYDQNNKPVNVSGLNIDNFSVI